MIFYSSKIIIYRVTCLQNVVPIVKLETMQLLKVYDMGLHARIS